MVVLVFSIPIIWAAHLFAFVQPSELALYETASPVRYGISSELSVFLSQLLKEVQMDLRQFLSGISEEDTAVSNALKCGFLLNQFSRSGTF